MSTEDSEDLSDLSDESYAAVEEIDEILTLCDDLPDRADDFREGVTDRLQSVREWVIEHDHVTEKQMSMIENTRAGVERWLD